MIGVLVGAAALALLASIPQQIAPQTSKHQDSSTLSHYDATRLSELQDTCWSADSWTHIPIGRHMGPVLQGLVSPAPQSFFAFQHALRHSHRIARSSADTSASNCTLTEFASRVVYHCQHLIKPTHRLAIKLPGHDNITAGWDEPGSDWTLVHESNIHNSSWLVIERAHRRPTTQQMAAAMVEHPVFNASCCTDLRERLWFSLATELRGRSSADAALSLALAGVMDEHVFATLSHTLHLEIHRRPFSPPMVHAVEKFLATGCTLNHKTRQGLPSTLPSCLWDDRPLLWLWRAAARLPRSPPPKTPQVPTLGQHIQEQQQRRQPLVVDVGCGFGVSLLHMACHRDEGASSPPHYVGCDTHPIAIRYAQGISKRWKMESRVTFVRGSAEWLLKELLESRQPVDMILLQFPTPFRLQAGEESSSSPGNTHLPNQNDFMGSRSTIQLVSKILHQQGNGASLLIQSNCEDVAVQLAQWGVEVGLSFVPTNDPVVEPMATATGRTERWLTAAPGAERAVGPGWSRSPLMAARSETEVSCVWQGVPVHRCLMDVESKRRT